MDPPRYQSDVQSYANSNELAFVRLRYKQPENNSSQLLEWNINQDEIIEDISNTSVDYRFSAAVAAFAQMLRGGEQLGGFQYQEILDLARSARGEDSFGYRSEFISLVSLADSLAAPVRNAEQQVGLID